MPQTGAFSLSLDFQNERTPLPITILTVLLGRGVILGMETGKRAHALTDNDQSKGTDLHATRCHGALVQHNV